MSLRVLILLLFLSLKALAINVGPKNEYVVLEDLNSEWFIFDNDVKTYLPLTNNNNSYQAHTVFFDKARFRPYYLLVHVQEEDNFIFVNNSIKEKLSKDSWHLYPVANLPSTDGEVSITIFGSNSVSNKEVYLVAKRKQNALTNNSTIKSNGIINIKQRPNQFENNSYVLIFCFIFSVIAITASANSRAFNEYFSLSNLFTFKLKDTKYLINKPLHRSNQPFILILALITTLLFVLLDINTHAGVANFVQFNFQSITLQILLRYLIGFAIIFGFYLFKYVFLYISSSLFGISKTLNTHYYRWLQATLYFFTGMTVMVFLYKFQPYMPITNFVQLVVALFIINLLIRTFFIFNTILKSMEISTVYLFAYLCIVEIIPSVILIRFMF